jgi:hypothetical protein
VFIGGPFKTRPGPVKSTLALRIVCVGSLHCRGGRRKISRLTWRCPGPEIPAANAPACGRSRGSGNGALRPLAPRHRRVLLCCRLRRLRRSHERSASLFVRGIACRRVCRGLETPPRLRPARSVRRVHSVAGLSCGVGALLGTIERSGRRNWGTRQTLRQSRRQHARSPRGGAQSARKSSAFFAPSGVSKRHRLDRLGIHDPIISNFSQALN